MQDICSDVEHVAAQLDYFERLQASGDASYDFYFGQEQASEEKTSKEWIHKMITDLGGNLTATFHNGFQRYRAPKLPKREVHGFFLFLTCERANLRVHIP